MAFLLIRNNRKFKKAQSTLEYAVLATAVAAAFIGMRTYLMRAINTNYRVLQQQNISDAVQK